MHSHTPASSLARVATIVLALLLVMPALGGELQVLVFELEGTRSVGPLPGAVLSLQSPTLSSPRVLVADAEGSALFEDLPAGNGYELTASLPGFANVVTDGIVVPETGRVDQRVGLAGLIEERIEIINRSPMADLEEGSTSSTELSSEFLSDLPIYGRNYQEILTVAPGVQDANGDGNPNVHGSRERDFQMTVDGISNVDPLTGQFLSYINPDAIEEIEVIDAGADASFGGAVGGYGRIITKSGSNEFEGTLNLYYQDSIFDGDGAGTTSGEDLAFRTLQPSLYLSGPIVRDKLWFVAAHERVNKETPFRVQFGTDFVQSQEALRSLDKLTWQVSPRNQLQFQYSSDPLRVTPDGADTLTPPESSYVFDRDGYTLSSRLTTTFSANFFGEATIAYSDTSVGKFPVSPGELNDCIDDSRYADLFCIDSDTGRRSGGYFQDFSDRRERLSYRWDGEAYLGDWLFGASHTLKFGVLLEDVTYGRAIERRPVASFANVVTVGDLQNPFASRPDRILSLEEAYPANADDEAEGIYWAAYVSDTINFGSRLVATIGLRVSGERLESDGWQDFDPFAEREAYDEAVIQCIANGGDDAACVEISSYLLTSHPLDDPANYPACSEAIHRVQCRRLEVVRQAGFEPKSRERSRFRIEDTNIAPRLSLAWDPWGDGKTKVFGSWGRYYGQTFLLPLVVENGPDTSSRQVIFNQYGSQISASNNLVSGFSIRTVDRDLEAQYSDEWTVGVEREIAPETSISVRYVERAYRNQLQDIDVNHAPVLFDELLPRDLEAFPLGCRQIGEFADCAGIVVSFPVQVGPFVLRRTIDVPDGRADVKVVNPMFNGIYEIGNYNSSDYRAYILELKRRFYQNWEMTASYTWSEAYGQAEDFDQVLGDDQTNVEDEKGLLGSDQTHVFKLAGRVFVNRWGGFRFGGSLRWESGLPYSIFFQAPILDFPDDLASGLGARRRTQQYFTLRTIFPTGERNDQRSEAFWTLDLNLQKEFDIKDLRLTVQIDCFNALNDDSLSYNSLFQSIVPIEPDLSIVPNAERRFGRRWQLALKANF